MARADQSPAQASCCGDKGSQALGKQGSGVGMGQVVGRGTAQPSSQKGGAEMDAEDNVCGMEDVGDKGEGASTSQQSAEEDGAADAKRGHLQRLGPMGRAMETGEEDSTFRRASRQEMAKHAPCTGVSGAQGVSQGAQENEKRGGQGDAALASSGSVEWLLWMERARGNSEANGHCGRKDCVEVEAPRNQPSHVAVDGVRVRQKPDGSESRQGIVALEEEEFWSCFVFLAHGYGTLPDVALQSCKGY